ncbi:2-phospho-L-lactate guanylyltransferase [Aquamicrobium sp. LC103]|uniref:2-phospho-L-lactate guanylyltransferase n=1 Tax=Aquamicrobium sp. LC103 TaxID=1120658 RepID=UPI00063E8276|nr:2-phospho-L-lactate guanylyltransferase [Aquamicrobium sp. LC103]TKT74511.1 2-phospho-L-lactate guanylyltransferase [Aquamicrobium sp. LC103]
MVDLVAIVPCKAFALGKSRLAPVLSTGERAELCEDFLISTLCRLNALLPAPEIVVLTTDPRAAEIARSAGATTIGDPDLGLNPAISQARASLPGIAKRVLIMPTDLPLADTEAITRFLSHAADVTIAPDRADDGTNLLAMTNAAFRHFPFLYGAGSLDRHLAAAAEAGLCTRIVREPTLAHDIDEPRDLEIWRRILQQPEMASPV